MRAPLLDAGLSKDEVRRAAQARGLSVWDKPAAACLSSRIAVGVPVSAERLARIERAEDGLLDLGLRVLRVRDHEDVARIEVGTDELMRLVEPELRQRIVETVRAAGYRHVTLDLEGYRPAGLLSVDSPRRTA